MQEPAALFARKKMNNDDDDDTIDEVEDDRLLSCRSSGGDNDTVFSSAFYYPSSFSQILIFKLISPPSDTISSIAAAHPRSYISYAESIAPFSSVPPDGVELVYREICSPPSILLR
jgi:hypothetical protein